jgi:hypothetical protein
MQAVDLDTMESHPFRQKFLVASGHAAQRIRLEAVPALIWICRKAMMDLL